MTTLEDMKNELDDCTAVKRVWIDNNNKLHVVVLGQTYGKVSDITGKYKKNRGVSQIEHPDASYSGGKQHYVFEE